MRLARIHRFAPATASVVALALGAAAPAAARAHHLPPRRGGMLHTAWPRHTVSGRPKLAMARWLARQVGPVKVHPRHGVRAHSRSGALRLKALGRGPVATMAASGSGWNLNFQVTSPGPGQQLALVRSYAIPSNDPALARLANLSWTYDSAVSATAFSELGDSAEAQQLLDQLAALQRTDGSIDFAYNTSNGQSIPLFRSGTVAWAALAAADYRQHACSARYDTMLTGAARWLLARQVLDQSQPTYGLLTGGPDVTWTSTQHNLIARALFANLADLVNGVAKQSGTNTRCAGGLSGLSASAATALATQLHQAVTLIDAGINRVLLVKPSATSAYFAEGVNDGAIPLDTQALGIMWLIGQGRQSQATAVQNYANGAMLLGSQTIGMSSNPASFNQTYSSTGPFTGYRPYANAGSPNVLWMEGTLEMRYALAQLGADTTNIDLSSLNWIGLTGATGPLQANATVTGNPFNEYHVWPSSSTAAWALLNLTPFSALSHA